MPNSTTQQITVDAQIILDAIKNITPAVEALVPAAKDNSELIALATSAASALIPLINLIPTGGAVTVEEQAAQYAKVYTILAGGTLTGPQWQKQS
jgi:hypothetical protein